MTRFGTWMTVLALLAATTTTAYGQAQPAEKPKTLLEEIALFAYLENSYVWNLGHTGRGDVNELRFYDFDAGWSFNMAEFSVKKEPSERYPFGFGLVLTAGLDAQKNHALGIFRDDDDAFPFRNTAKVDLQEAYGSYKIPVGSGLTVKAGKFVTLLGYEVIESPLNLNFSRSFLFGFAIPLTHVGALASYAFTDWLTVTAGPVVGWDVADDNNDTLSVTGQFALTPLKDLTTNLNWIVGPEQFDNKTHQRFVLDFVVNYTGIKNLTLGLNLDIGHEEDEPSLAASGTRAGTDASWWGWAAYAAYDWTEKLRTSARLEYFQDPEGVRTLALGAGSKVSLWEVTATTQYKIWKGLVGRLEYRHDDADEKVFKVRAPGLVPTSKSQDTLTLALYYSFF
ncbi:MAG: porin [Candidatus Rokubacteria bacterium]|nr:porin [Candidatus Rokubacteria bacterium]